MTRPSYTAWWQTHRCEQLAQGCYAALSQWELNLQVQHLTAMTLCDPYKTYWYIKLIGHLFTGHVVNLLHNANTIQKAGQTEHTLNSSVSWCAPCTTLFTTAGTKCWNLFLDDILDVQISHFKTQLENCGHWKSSTFVAIEKPIYDFLLVINCYLSSISHRFWHIALQSQKPPHPSLNPRIRGSFVFRDITWQTKRYNIALHFY